MSSRHVFVAVEGLKGSGKTTISTLLAEQLGAKWFTTPSALFRPIRDAVHRYGTPMALHYYHYAGIVQTSAEIEAVLGEQPVVCDKYLATFLAYSRAQGIPVTLPSQDLVIRPDVTVLLRLPQEVRVHRIACRGPYTREVEDFVNMELAHDVMKHYLNQDPTVWDNSAPDVPASVASLFDIVQDAARRLGRVLPSRFPTGSVECGPI